MVTIVAEVDIANRITIPKAIRDLLSIEVGDVIELEFIKKKKGSE